MLRFKDKNPMYSSVDDTKLKKVIHKFNGKIWDTVLNNRNGVELPESLGYLFIGSCPAAKKINVDYALSKQYGKLIQNKNWDTDGHVGKIFYTNYETKYRFKHHEMWGFSGIRNFKRTVAQTYPVNWKKYVMVDNLVRISRIFRKEKYKEFLKNETLDLLNNYDEFNLE